VAGVFLTVLLTASHAFSGDNKNQSPDTAKASETPVYSVAETRAIVSQKNRSPHRGRVDLDTRVKPANAWSSKLPLFNTKNSMEGKIGPDFLATPTAKRNLDDKQLTGAMNMETSQAALPMVPISCGASGNISWTTTSSSFVSVRECSIGIPTDGWIFISADGTVARQDGEYEANFRIGVDSTTGDPDIDRWVNVYDDAGDGSDTTLALSVLKPITAGQHTVHLLGRRNAGTATVKVYDPTLSVVFVPSTDTQLMACGDSGNANWTTASATFDIVRQCSLTVPGPGWVFLSADGTVARDDGEYEGSFGIDIDNTAGDPNIDRWINVYDDSGDGTDRSVALSAIRAISTGLHTFYFLGKRYSGSADVLVYDPTLTALYVPSTPGSPVLCEASGNLNWTTTSSSFEVIRQCALEMPESGSVLISADACVARQNGEYEGNFRIGIDSTDGDPNIDRWVDVYNDTGDGSDTTLALSVLRHLEPGPHTIYLLGRRQSGTAEVLAYDPTLSVIQVGSDIIFADGFESGNTVFWSATVP
jgi:hypothetical protein